MIEATTYTETFRKNYDPTHTTALRNAFVKEMKRRFREIAVAIKIGVDKNDCFRLEKKVHTFQAIPPVKGAFAFPTSQAKLAEFMKWLERQVENGILTVKELRQIGTGVEAVWTNLYLFDSYKRGVMRARYEMITAGMKIPSVEDSGGINIVMGLPFHIDRIGLLYTRVFTDLKGITAAMDTAISRVLAQGIADGDGPALLARKLVATIDGENLGKLGLTDTLGRYISPLRRAEMLARTEIIRAFNEAQLQEFRNWGVEGVNVKAEWKTAGDARVCEQCFPMEGKIFTLDEASGMIPAHPNCRCCFLPYIEELQKYK